VPYDTGSRGDSDPIINAAATRRADADKRWARDSTGTATWRSGYVGDLWVNGQPGPGGPVAIGTANPTGTAITRRDASANPDLVPTDANGIETFVRNAVKFPNVNPSVDGIPAYWIRQMTADAQANGGKISWGFWQNKMQQAEGAPEGGPNGGATFGGDEAVRRANALLGDVDACGARQDQSAVRVQSEHAVHRRDRAGKS